MGWSASNLSGAGILAILNGNGATSGSVGPFYGASSTQNFHSDTVNAALYGTTPTPNKDDTLAHNAYNGAGGQWVTANESTGTNYTPGGSALASKTETEATGTVTFDAADLSWATVTLSGVFGCLVYDNTVTNKYAFCWNYFGGSQAVTAGTFTVQWNASGIFTITIS